MCASELGLRRFQHGGALKVVLEVVEVAVIVHLGRYLALAGSCRKLPTARLERLQKGLLAAFPGEAGCEHRLVARRDELEIADREPGPAEHVERAQERGRRDPHLELIAVDGRDLDAQHRRDVDVDARPVPAPDPYRLARPLDLYRLDRLRVLELAADVVAVLVRTGG